MQNLARDMTTCFTPRWTWRSVIFAAAISLCLYLLLPYLETLSSKPTDIKSIRSITTAELPPPPPLAKTKSERIREDNSTTPKPKLRMSKRKLSPMLASVNLSMALGDIGGDFSLDFDISGQQLEQQVKQFVFEISDLDQPPRPLARLNPIYPPQARMRSIEGFVVLEFIVSPNGSVQEIEVVAAEPGMMFTDAAIRAIKRWRFAPGQKQGEAVSTRVRQKIEFSLN